MTTSSIINPKQTFSVDAVNAHYLRSVAIGLKTTLSRKWCFYDLLMFQMLV